MTKAHQSDTDFIENEKRYHYFQKTYEKTHQAYMAVHSHLSSLLNSRFLKLGWKLKLARKPDWIEDFISEPPKAFLPIRQRRLLLAQKDPNQMTTALNHLADKKFSPDIILDIGAAQGYWSRRTARIFPQAQFFMIDPLKENEQSLADLCGSDSRFQYVLTAVGDQAGTASMNVTADLDGSTMLDYEIQDTEAKRSVPVETIDHLLEKNRIISPKLVKMDVQGAELKVLAGGTRLFETTEVFILEANMYSFMPECPRIHEIIHYMAQKGFFLFDIAGMLRRPYQNDLGQLDLVFASEKSPLVESTRWN